MSRQAEWIHGVALPFAFAVCGLFWIGPYWAWGTNVFFRLSVVLVLSAFTATFVVSRRTFSQRNIFVTLLLLAVLLYYGSRSGRGGPFEISYGWTVLVAFMLSDERVKRESFRFFSIIFALTLVPGLITFVLSAIGLEPSWQVLHAVRFEFDALQGNEPGYYRQYLGSVVMNDQAYNMGVGTVLRLHGMYDEPGTAGTFSALLLVADGVTLRRRPHNVILLIGGLATLSLGFYVIMFMFLLARRPLPTLAAAGALVTAIVSSATLAALPVVDLFFLSRLTFSGGRLLADNRVTGLFAVLYQDFWNSDLGTILFGSPGNVSLLVNTGTFSYKLVVLVYGVVGAAALVAFLTTATLAVSRNRAVLILLAVFLASIYQRPNVLMIPYLLILLGGAENLAASTAASRTPEPQPA